MNLLNSKIRVYVYKKIIVKDNATEILVDPRIANVRAESVSSME